MQVSNINLKHLLEALSQAMTNMLDLSQLYAAYQTENKEHMITQ